jgi:hypothetical protein
VQEQVDHPLGHPKNKIGCKRAKKILQLERQVAQTTTELKKVSDFQSKVMSDAVGAAKSSMVALFSDFRQQIIDNVREIVYNRDNRGSGRRYDQGSALLIRNGDSEEKQSSDCYDDVEGEDDVLCTAHHPPPAVAPSYVPPPLEPLIEFDFLG